MDESEELVKQSMRLGMKQHAYHFLKTKYESELGSDVGMEEFIKQWAERATATESSLMNEKNRAVSVELLESQRHYLTQLNMNPTIDEDLIRQQLYQIDIEEERLRILYR